MSKAPVIALAVSDGELRQGLACALRAAAFEVATVVPDAGERRGEDDGGKFLALVAVSSGADREALALIGDLAMRCTSAVVVALGRSDDAAASTAALARGAVDYCLAPRPGAPADELVAQLRQIWDASALASPGEQVPGHPRLIGRDPSIRQVLERIHMVAPTSISVLILGGTGTGKELVARAIHDASRRRDAPFVKVNCAAIPETLIESELFGFERGAFTGAHARRIGRFGRADGGTLFLDEIADMPLVTQVKLLRVLQTGEYEPLGATSTLKTDIRLLAATNMDPVASIARGSFREDLYYRINGVPIELPLLKNRIRDVPMLARFFLDRAAEKFALPRKILADEAVTAMLAHDWPGNVRELENAMERALVLAQGSTIDNVELDAGSGNSAPARPPSEEPSPAVRPDLAGLDALVDLEKPLAAVLEQVTTAVERAYLEKLLDREHGRVGRVAAHAGINRRTLYNKLLQLGLRKEPFR